MHIKDLRRSNFLHSVSVWFQVHVLVQLALADFLAAVILMVSSAMNKGNIHKSEDICQYALPLSLVSCHNTSI